MSDTTGGEQSARGPTCGG